MADDRIFDEIQAEWRGDLRRAKESGDWSILELITPAAVARGQAVANYVRRRDEIRDEAGS